MRAVKDTFLAFGYDSKHGIDGKIGGINVLHTWTQQLTYHPHVHCIIPAGGITKTGQWKQAKSRGNFLFPVKAMSAYLEVNYWLESMSYINPAN